MKNIFPKLGLIVIAVMLSACSQKTTVRRHHDFHPYLSGAKNISVLPATVVAVNVESSGKTKRNYNYESMVEDVIIDVLRPKLMQKGYRVKFITRREIHEKKVSGKVLSFREQYNDKIAELYKEQEWSPDKAHDIKTFMAPAKELAEELETDLIILIEYNLRVKTRGACAKDVTIAIVSNALFGVGPEVDPNELLALRVAIINPNNGHLVWSNFGKEGYGAFSGMFSKDSKSLEKNRLNENFDTLLKELPKRGA